MQVPAERIVQVPVAFFPSVPLAEIEYTDKLAGKGVRSDEDCFRGLLSRP
jgi:hypothetical protein